LFQDTIKPYLYYKTVDSLGSANFRILKVDDVTEQMMNSTNNETVEDKIDLSKYAPIENLKDLQNKVDILNERLNMLQSHRDKKGNAN
jgi:phage I-like protein